MPVYCYLINSFIIKYFPAFSILLSARLDKIFFSTSILTLMFFIYKHLHVAPWMCKGDTMHSNFLHTQTLISKGVSLSQHEYLPQHP